MIVAGSRPVIAVVRVPVVGGLRVTVGRTHRGTVDDLHFLLRRVGPVELVVGLRSEDVLVQVRDVGVIVLRASNESRSRHVRKIKTWKMSHLYRHGVERPRVGVVVVVGVVRVVVVVVAIIIVRVVRVFPTSAGVVPAVTTIVVIVILVRGSFVVVVIVPAFAVVIIIAGRFFRGLFDFIGLEKE